MKQTTRYLGIALTTLMLTACGLKGPLYMPTEDKPTGQQPVDQQPVDQRVVGQQTDTIDLSAQ